MNVKVTERTFYPFLMDVIKGHGGAGVSEIKYNSEPDIVFDFVGRKWLLGVKLGETIPILKSAFIQYHRHKDESKIDHGILLFLPEEARSIKPTDSSVAKAVNGKRCTCLIDTPDLKVELKDITFPRILAQIVQEIYPKLERKESQGYSLTTVIPLLK